MAKILIQYGAKIDAFDDYNYAPIHYAIIANNYEQNACATAFFSGASQAFCSKKKKEAGYFIVNVLLD